ncbi:hypothetical protein V8C34DRAFT_207979 [Trichoderma compactum]
MPLLPERQETMRRPCRSAGSLARKSTTITLTCRMYVFPRRVSDVAFGTRIRIICRDDHAQSVTLKQHQQQLRDFLSFTRCSFSLTMPLFRLFSVWDTVLLRTNILNRLTDEWVTGLLLPRPASIKARARARTPTPTSSYAECNKPNGKSDRKLSWLPPTRGPYLPRLQPYSDDQLVISLTLGLDDGSAATFFLFLCRVNPPSLTLHPHTLTPFLCLVVPFSGRSR